MSFHCTFRYVFLQFWASSLQARPIYGVLSSRSHLGEHVPRLRFPGFDEDWGGRKFGSVFDFIPNNTLARSELARLSTFETKASVLRGLSFAFLNYQIKVFTTPPADAVCAASELTFGGGCAGSVSPSWFKRDRKSTRLNSSHSLTRISYASSA